MSESEEIQNEFGADAISLNPVISYYQSTSQFLFNSLDSRKSIFSSNNFLPKIELSPKDD